ncbi:MAG: glycoside hydrolase family 127 protein, partial [Clostridiales bacterium]|nr:glycoside hydrolase family 127 protein [Clostridiales bacterium]
MKSADFKNVTLRSGFLHQKHLLNKKITLDAVYNRLVDTGRIAAFDFDGTVTPHFFWDSDVAKWMESAAYVLAENPNPDLQSKIEHLIDRFEEHQEKDGYFNLYFMQVNPNGRFTDRNMHELYCLGGFIEAAIAYYDATGRDRFLKCVIKYVDYVYKYIIEENRGAFKTPGHEEIELALVKLYYCTNNRKYLDMAAFFINNRGVCDDPPIEPERFTHYSDQSHLPVRRQETAEGHAVRACYLYSAMADLAFALGDEELKKACRQLFNDIISHKMYITGGIGSTRFYEGFTSAYDLPNERAYAETCAAISLIFFAQRMQLLDNDAVYADIIERELYNGFISGLSLSGDAFFYENPLEIDLENYTKYKPLVNGEQFAPYRRKKVFDCFCCPPNITRVLAILGSYIYSFDDDACYINQFTDSTVSQDGMEVTQTTDYPLDGTVNISLKNVKRLCIRIPSWCTKFKLSCGYRTEK